MFGAWIALTSTPFKALCPQGAFLFARPYNSAVVGDNLKVLRREGDREVTMVYASALRCIGQELESRDIEVFEVKRYAYEFRVQAGDPNFPYTGLIEIKLSAAQIELLDRRGQTRRGQSKEEMKFDTIPNMLRAVGEYIDKHGSLRRVDNSYPLIGDQPAIEVEYQTSAGDIRLEALPMSIIRQASVSMYKRRAHRPDISFARKRNP